MLQGKTDAALDFFTITSKDKYSKIFSILKNELPDIMNSMSDLELIYIKDSEAKYRIKRDQVINGKTYDITYYVYFFQDPFGYWHLDSF